MGNKPSYEELEQRVKELELAEFERKRVEKALRESQGRYRSLFKNNHSVMLVIDPKNGNIVDANPAACSFYGLSLEELTAKKITDINMLSKEQVFQEMERAKSERRHHFIFRHRLSNGDIRDVEVYSGPIQLHGQRLLYSIIHDITDRKHAEEALQKSEHLLNDVIESIQDGISVLNTDLTIRRVNGVMNQWYAKNLPLEGKKCYLCYHNSEEPCNPCPTLRCLQSGQTEREIVSGLPGSPVKWIELFSYPIKDRNSGEITGVVEFVRDISDRIRLETSLRQAYKMESIGTLAGGIAHDFNNILGIIIGNTELALDDIPKWNPAHFNLEEIKTASLRAKDIVRKLLSFSRHTDQELKTIEIVPVTKNALKFLRSTIPTTIDIRHNILATDETILADPTQINQLLMNLCVNAYHAMEQTGGVINIGMESVIVDEEDVKSYLELNKGHYFKITVSDTGPGIDPEIIDQIYDPYFTTKKVGKGSGMGLAVVHGIVKSHGGAISVTSEVGKGTTFTVLFPLAEKLPEAEAFKTKELPLCNEKILFVDDEKSIVNMSRQMLERLGYQVEAKMNPVEALKLFQSKSDQFDLVITDMTMPQMTGIKFSEKLMEIRSDIPVIICTGHSSLIDETKAKSIGIAAYVIKPIVKQELANTIRRVLTNKKGFIQGSLH